MTEINKETTDRSIETLIAGGSVNLNEIISCHKIDMDRIKALFESWNMAEDEGEQKETLEIIKNLEKTEI